MTHLTNTNSPSKVSPACCHLITEIINAISRSMKCLKQPIILILEEKRACMSSIFKIVDKLHVQHNFFLFIIKKSFFPFIKNYFSNISNWYKFFIVIDHNPFFFLKWHVLLARRFLALSVQHDYIFGSCWHDTPFWPSQKSQPEHEYFMFSGYPIKLKSNKNKK